MYSKNRSSTNVSTSFLGSKLTLRVNTWLQERFNPRDTTSRQEKSLWQNWISFPPKGIVNKIVSGQLTTHVGLALHGLGKKSRKWGSNNPLCCWRRLWGGRNHRGRAFQQQLYLICKLSSAVSSRSWVGKTMTHAGPRELSRNPESWKGPREVSSARRFTD